MSSSLLVTGANGFLGSWVIEQGQGRWQIQGTYRSSPLAAPGICWVQADFRTEADVLGLLDRTRPEAVLHLAAQSNTTACDRDPPASQFINAELPGLLARACGDRHLPLVFTSSGMVFDGKKGNYRETDPVGPLNHYARQKAEAERQVLDIYPDAIVARMPLMFSFAQPRAISVGVGAEQRAEKRAAQKPAPRSAMAALEAQLQQGQAVTLFTDEIRTPVSAAVAATGLLQALDWAIAGRHRGLLHLGGRTALSRYDLGRLLARLRGYSLDSITACRQQDVDLAAPRPQNVSLDSSLAFSLGYGPPDLEEQLRWGG